MVYLNNNNCIAFRKTSYAHQEQYTKAALIISSMKISLMDELLVLCYCMLRSNKLVLRIYFERLYHTTYEELSAMGVSVSLSNMLASFALLYCICAGDRFVVKCRRFNGCPRGHGMGYAFSQVDATIKSAFSHAFRSLRQFSSFSRFSTWSFKRSSIFVNNHKDVFSVVNH